MKVKVSGYDTKIGVRVSAPDLVSIVFPLGYEGGPSDEIDLWVSESKKLRKVLKRAERAARLSAERIGQRAS